MREEGIAQGDYKSVGLNASLFTLSVLPVGINSPLKLGSMPFKRTLAAGIAGMNCIQINKLGLNNFGSGMSSLAISMRTKATSVSSGVTST